MRSGLTSMCIFPYKFAFGIIKMAFASRLSSVCVCVHSFWYSTVQYFRNFSTISNAKFYVGDINILFITFFSVSLKHSSLSATWTKIRLCVCKFCCCFYWCYSHLFAISDVNQCKSCAKSENHEHSTADFKLLQSSNQQSDIDENFVFFKSYMRFLKTKNEFSETTCIVFCVCMCGVNILIAMQCLMLIAWLVGRFFRVCVCVLRNCKNIVFLATCRDLR